MGIHLIRLDVAILMDTPIEFIFVLNVVYVGCKVVAKDGL